MCVATTFIQRSTTGGGVSVGELLACKRELWNTTDQYAIAGKERWNSHWPLTKEGLAHLLSLSKHGKEYTLYGGEKIVS